ncbi:MAG: leucine-rich repeat domain-containing protein [Muribaculaceae bacterium]|nr:leucine-rich repeat domain-containing protein [Muribaculaceae bacterium]
MQIFKKVLFPAILLGSMMLCACSTDEPESTEGTGTTSENNSSITINANGSTSSSGVVFSPIDENTFYLDFIKYKIVDSHLEIVGYDPVEIAENVKPFATVKYNGTTYQTRKIQDFAFENSEIKSIEIPSTVISIGLYAFAGSKLFSVKFPKGLLELRRQSFFGCENLTTISLPSGLKSCAPYAFALCYSLTSVYFSEGIENIEYNSFCGCYNLKSIQFPSTLKRIYAEAFGWCYNLKTISLSDGIEDISEYAFCNCFNLDTITCASIKPPHLSKYAFVCVSSMPYDLDEILRDHIEIPEYITSDYSIYNHVLLKVPQYSIETYRNSDGWELVKSIVAI